MSPSLSLEGMSLSSIGPALSLSLLPRHSLSVFGPAGSGKTAFLRVCAGLQKPERGSVKKFGKACFAGAGGFARKATPLSLAQAAAAKGSHHPAEALSALGLWDVRKKPTADLSPGQAQACELVGLLSCSDDILLIDGQLDRLDPWALKDTLALLQRRAARGAILLIASNRPEWAPLTDHVVVLRDQRLVFAGRYDDLERQGSPTQIQIEGLNQEGVRALCDPFEVQLTESEGGLMVRAVEGQALAARMLLEGYGDVKSVFVRRPGPQELIEGLIR